MKALAVFGNPISHSKSPRIHNYAIKSLGLNAFYTRYLLDDEKDLRARLFALSLDGANITVPFKKQALDCADFKDELALKIGSANTLLVKNNKIYAYNTDAPGFLQAISSFKDVKKALILGAGGTARAIAFALLSKGVDVCVANRSSVNLEAFSFCKTSLYDDLQDFEFECVINSTSAGLNNDDLPCKKELLSEILQNAKFAFDVIYGKETAFLKLCKSLNVHCKDGLDMLLWQAVFAFELFFDIKDREREIAQAMYEAIALK